MHLKRINISNKKNKMNLNFKLNGSLKSISFIVALLINFVKLTYGQTPTLPPFFTDQLISNTWNQPLGIAFDGNKRMYVWEKAGYVWTVDTNGVKSSVPLLDIKEEVGNWVDHGLNGFALDPNFLSNGYFYCFYTVDRHYLLYYGTPAYKANKSENNNATIARVVRFQADINTNFNTIVPNSKTILIGATKKDGIVITHTSHSGGSLVFGKDGSLLISTGDGASFNGIDSGSSVNSLYYQALLDTMITTRDNVGSYKSQLLNCYNGKILRIDPMTGLGLPTNPYYDSSNPNSARSKVWCLGLRNPFRIVLAPNTGSTDITAGQPGVLIIGDVGWFNYEEVNVSKNGGENFGWPLFEGLTPHADYSNLLVKNYDAPNPAYNGTTCNQQYFYFKDLIKQATLDTTIKFTNPCNTSQQITSYPTYFQTRPQVDYKHNNPLVRAGIFNGNTAGVINVGAPASPVQGVQFAGNTALAGTWYTDNKMPAIYQGKYYHIDYGSGWIKRMNFDTNFNLTQIDSFYTNMNKATFLCVNPNDGCFNYIAYQNNEVRKICYTQFINNPPVPVITVDKKFGQSPATVIFNANKSYDFETKINLSYSWSFGDGYSSTNMIASHVYNVPSGLPSRFWASLTVTDSLGLSKTDSISISVNNTPPQVNITSLKDSDYYAMSHQSVVNLIADVLDTEHPDSTLNYQWQVTLYHNNHSHPGPIDYDKVTQAVLDPEGCDGDVFYYAITLKVTDPLGLCGYDTVRLFPACAKPLAKIKTPSTSVCIGKSVQFEDSSKWAGTYFWIFPGGTPSTSTLKSPIIFYNTPGSYHVKLIVSNPEGADSITKLNLITVIGSTLTISATSDSICNQASTSLSTNALTGASYSWFKDGIIIPAATASTYTTTVAANYTVLVTEQNGCSSTISKNIYQKAISATITGNKTMPLCNNDTITFTTNAVGLYTYQWKRNNKKITGATGPACSSNLAGNFFLETNNNGCIKKSNTIKVVLTPTYTVSASGPITFCNGDSVTLNVTNMLGNYTIQWRKFGNAIAGANSQNLVVKNSGSYSVAVTDSNGCSRISAAFKVTVNCKFGDNNLNYIDDVSIQPNPVTDKLEIHFTLINKVDLNINIFDLTGRKVYSEALEDSNAGDNSLTIDVTKFISGIYQLEITDFNGNFKSLNRFVKSN